LREKQSFQVSNYKQLHEGTKKLKNNCLILPLSDSENQNPSLGELTLYLCMSIQGCIRVSLMSGGREIQG
jgi:hypothetical protein